MTDWASVLLSWTKPASDAEEDKRDRTEAEIKAAIDSHPRLSADDVVVYAKGSYANNTNVRRDSDVDIAVEYRGGYFSEGLDDETSRAEAGWRPYDGPYSKFTTFKADVEEALAKAFGQSAVTRKNKCITVRGRRTTLPADVVPSWEYRDYFRQFGRLTFRAGVAFYADDGAWIENYPQQDHDNGVAMNDRTGTRYKKTVRALKRLENALVAERVIDEVPSYLVECLVHQCPDSDFPGSRFGTTDYLVIARRVLATIFNHTMRPESDEEDGRWLEVNGIKYLFHPAQKWTRQQAHRFADAAWDHLGLE